jgi:hypothetical protein
MSKRPGATYEDYDDDPAMSAIPGYRYYTTHDDHFPTDPRFNNNNDDQSLSTNSNAVEYAATLAID